MKCLILAAGYATRLYPLTENFPKPLLAVRDNKNDVEKSILDWLVDDVASTGLGDEFVIISNHRFAEHFEEWSNNKIWKKTEHTKVTIVDDQTSTNETRLGAVRDIQYALDKTGIEDDLLVLAGDNVLDFSLGHFVAYAKNVDTSCVMCHEEHVLEKQQRTAIITFDKTGLIETYEEKPKEPKSCYAVPPFYFYKREDATRIPQALAEGCNADAPGSFAAWLSQKVPMHAYVMPGKRYDIGNLESYEEVRRRYRGVER